MVPACLGRKLSGAQSPPGESGQAAGAYCHASIFPSPQVLGPKPALPAGTEDTAKEDAANRSWPSCGQGEPGLRSLGSWAQMGLQETWVSPALLAGGLEPGMGGGATRGLGFYGL